MNKIIIILIGVIAMLFSTSAKAQSSDVELEGLQVGVNTMDDGTRKKITGIVEQMQEQGGATRGVVSDILKSALTGGITATLDVIGTEIVNLAHYKKNQKRKWMEMIERECNYTDSIQNLQGLQDFYSETSTIGALDPSNLNFNGISIRGMREGKEVLYLSCHIDTARLSHLIQHSKFNLVLDTMAFHPYECHLPNLQANGIRLMKGQQSERDNSFSFDERTNLRVGIEMEIFSSWINEAVMVMDNVKLGEFKMNININTHDPIFTYSRRQIEQNRLNARRSTYNNQLSAADTTFIGIEGDCFVVPRSFMPVNGGQRMWGTGEYNIKVKMRESCQFSNDEEKNKKMKQWYRDYKQLRKMQRKGKGTEVGEYFRTVWQQNENTIMKKIVKSSIDTGAKAVGL